MAKAWQKLLVFWLILVLCPSSAFAAIDIYTYPVSDSFSVTTGPEVVTLCQCESFVDTMTVMNTGQFANKYSLSFSSSLVSVSEASFELLPGKSKTVYAIVQAPCARELSEEVSFRVDDLFGNSFVFDKSYEVRKCQNLEATLAVDAAAGVQPCAPVTYELLVNNTGVFTETYDLVFGKGKFEASFDRPYQTLIIPPGKSGIASSSLLLPCDQSGTFSIPFTVTASQNGLVAELEHDLEVLPAYDFTASIEAIPEACALDTMEIPLVITNGAAFENSYSLVLEAPPVGFSLVQSSVNVPAGESVTIPIRFSPFKSVVGKQSFTVTLMGGIGGVTKSLKGEVVVKDCYGVSLNIDLQEDVEACSSYAEYPVIVKNTGLVKESIALEIWGMAYASFDDYQVSLEPGEEELLILEVDVPQNDSVHTLATIRATVEGKDVFAEDKIVFKMLDEEACYQPLLEEKRVRVRDDEQSVKLVVVNSGVEDAAYEFAFDGPSFFAIDPDTSLITARPGERYALSLLMHQDDSAVQERYEGVVQAFVKSADGEHVIVYESPITISVYHKSFLVRSFEYFKGHPCQFSTLVLLALIVLGGLLVLARPDKPRKSHREVTVIVILLWLLAVIFVLSLFGLPRPLYDSVPSSEDSLTFIIAEDSSASLDLSHFFVDPDQDSLSFSVSEMDNVSVVVDNATATFTPDRDWAGSRRFRIIASDGAGGVAESPRMALQVIDRPEYSLWDIYARYCCYLNLLLLAIVAFLIIVLARVEDNRRPAEPPRPTTKADRNAAPAKKYAAKSMPKRRLVKKKR